MAFRVLVIGGRNFNCVTLRDALGRMLAKRLQDVEVLTAGGPGAPALTACSVAVRGLTLARRLTA